MRQRQWLGAFLAAACAGACAARALDPSATYSAPAHPASAGSPPRTAAPAPSASDRPTPSAAPTPDSAVPPQPRHAIPLFARYPRLAALLPRAVLDPLFTPVTRLDALGAELGFAGLHVKRDDQLGSEFGGSKIRKLEFILGAALAERRTTIVTFGGVGSNHALATALHARKLGLHAVLILLPEPNSPRVRANLLALHATGAELHLGRNDRIENLLSHPSSGAAASDAPFVVEPGGSSPLGCVGYVNAAFELREQIERGEVPRPDVLYVAAGSAGTAVGLLVGLAAAGLPILVRAVRVSSPRYVNASRFRTLFDDTVALLHGLDDTFPEVRLSPGAFEIVQSQAGGGYAMPTPAARRAVVRMREQGAACPPEPAARSLERFCNPIVLDTTYTGKAFAAVLAQAHLWKDRQVLFWDTFDPRMVPADGVTPADLPPEFRGWFVSRP